jgi:hypothetical protein
MGHTPVMRQSVLERIVEQRVGQSLVGNVSTAIDRIAEEIAKETLRDESFRHVLRELVHRRSEEVLEQLLRTRPGRKAAPRPAESKRRPRGAS